MSTTTSTDRTDGPVATLRRLLRSEHSREATLAVLVVVMIAAASWHYPRFFTWDNARVILNNLAADGVLAIGMMTLLIAGVFDLSVGSTFALGGVMLAYLMSSDSLGWPFWLAAPASLTVVAVCGLFNGLVVAKVRVNPLITTLATMGIFRGAALLIGGTGQSLPDSTRSLPTKEYWGLYLLLVLAVLFHYLLAHTRFFRQFYYVGGNAKAAELSGIPVERLQVLAFVIMALLAGLAGIADAIRVGGGSATAGTGTELTAITAVVLGGASLSGGKGTVLGALLGVAFMALTASIMNFANVSSNWKQITISSVLVAIVALDSWLNRRRR
jgi:ribose/xylose/arabinose/galactoside ABC-type transport system permease subunit